MKIQNNDTLEGAAFVNAIAQPGAIAPILVLNDLSGFARVRKGYQ